MLKYRESVPVLVLSHCMARGSWDHITELHNGNYIVDLNMICSKPVRVFCAFTKREARNDLMM